MQDDTAKLKCTKFSVTPGTELGFIGTKDEVRDIALLVTLDPTLLLDIEVTKSEKLYIRLLGMWPP